MNVLSLFDGISCARVALERAEIKIDKYFASEVDKHAIKIAQKNYPDTVHVSDIVLVTQHILPKIDLIIGGSPCQGFSFAGKQLNFEDHRSRLFFELVRIVKECQPKYFILENVMMKQEYQDVISDYLGVKPIMINAALVSAQTRKRLFWTNIKNVKQPEDRNIIIEDIIEKEQVIVDDMYKNRGLRVYSKKAPTLRSERSGLKVYKTTKDNNTLDSRCIQVGEADINGHDFLKRVYSTKGKAPTLTAICGGNQERKIAIDEKHWRKLTPIECERLQSLPDNYTEGISNSQRYRCLGNAFNVEVVAHIIKHIIEEQ